MPLTETRTLIDELLVEQQALTAVERFARWHEAPSETAEPAYRQLLPASAPHPGEQYAFEVNLDQCSGCKACVTACHSLNGLEETETWRSVGLLISDSRTTHHAPAGHNSTFRAPHSAFQQHVTTACHHCADPGCLNGCPVLAYDKDPLTGIVRHLDDQCIGCQYCVMKCPYEVPKYSDRLGIVRKCDMCHSRLAVGEAPVCVQACPNEAIRITLVETEAVRGKYRPRNDKFRMTNDERNTKPELNSSFVLRPSSFGFLPDSPHPALTLPTTRFLSKKLSFDLHAADHAAPRRDQPHWPLIIMLVLTQSAAGLFLTESFIEPAAPLRVSGFGLLVAGLIASISHLGQPLKAWRAFLGWRKSWLSREIIAFNAFAGVAFMAILNPPCSILAAAFGLIAVSISAMVYVDTGRALWSPGFTFGNFFGATFLLGASFTTAITGWTDNYAPAQPFAMASLLLYGVLFAWRRFVFRTALRNPQSPIHLNARVVYELLPWSIPVQNRLFIASIVFGLLSIFNAAAAAPWWASLAAITTLGSEIVARHIFFAASADKRMPGGVAA